MTSAIQFCCCCSGRRRSNMNGSCSFSEVVVIPSMDVLSTAYDESAVDEILTVGDISLLKAWCDTEAPKCYEVMKLYLGQIIDEPEVLGPLIDQLYNIIYLVKNAKSVEHVLVVLSGHGIDPDDVELVRSDIHPHPTRKGDDTWTERFFHSSADYRAALTQFYSDCHESIKTASSGFVGGEVDVHQRGFIGVLGLLGLWCFAAKGQEGHSLSVVVDCCYAGKWVEILRELMSDVDQTIQTELRTRMEAVQETLKNNTVYIQASCGADEPSCAGIFFPIWVASQSETKDSDLTAIPKQTASWSSTTESTPKLESIAGVLEQTAKAKNNFNTAVAAVKEYLLEQNRKFEAQKVTLLRFPDSYVNEIAKAEGNIALNVAARKALDDEHHFRFRSPLISKKFDMLDKFPNPNSLQDITPGVHVFAGGIGDMSLIVSPENEFVILIDGSHTLATTREAWNNVLGKLRRITHIIVTHHDTDHGKGIQLLLARFVHGTDSEKERLKGCKIYINQRKDLSDRTKGYALEASIVKLAKMLAIEVLPAIVNDTQAPRMTVISKDFDSGLFKVDIILPTQTLQQNCASQFHTDDDLAKIANIPSTKQVKTKGRTTAANVLSINVLAQWQDDAYLFTGDAHLTDVTNAVGDCDVERLKYADVPHHGSVHSNRTDVESDQIGMALGGIRVDNYLISSCGNQHNPHPGVVADVLTRAKASNSTVHFLYPKRTNSMGCNVCNISDDGWYCKGCVKDVGNINMSDSGYVEFKFEL